MILFTELVFMAVISATIFLALIRWSDTKSLRGVYREIIIFLIAGGELCVFIYASRYETILTKLSVYCKKYAWIHYIFGILLFLYCMIEIVAMIRYRRSTINRGSIRYALEHLDLGLFYSDAEGTPILLNRRMRSIIRLLFEEDIQNGKELWERLKNANVAGDVKRLNFTTTPTFQLPDGSVYNFVKARLSDETRVYFEIIAYEVTERYLSTETLRKETEALAQTEERLFKTYENIAEIRQEEELITYKMKVHDQLGNAILRTRKLTEESFTKEDRQEVLTIWQNTVNSLRANMIAGVGTSDNMLGDIQATAKSIGCKLEIQGTLPKQSELLSLVIREALYNAVRHGKATVVTVDSKKRDKNLFLHIEDNGYADTDTIIEGGGLSGLRRHIESVGGSIKIHVEEGVQLDIVVPM